MVTKKCVFFQLSKDHEVASSVGNSSVAGDDELEEQCESVFTAVVTAKDGERPMQLAFQLLPSKLVGEKHIS
jgi:hypothetical protein